MCVQPMAFEVFWLPDADPHGYRSFTFFASSMSVLIVFFHPRYLYLDNWIKSLIITGSVSQIMVQVTL